MFRINRFIFVVLFGFVNIKSEKKVYNENTFTDENVLYKIIHANM